MYDLKKRRPTRQIHIGKVAIGGGAPISVQSMTNTKTTDTEATVAQIRALQAAGCDIVRLAVPDMEAAKNLGIPLVVLERPQEPEGLEKVETTEELLAWCKAL